MQLDAITSVESESVSKGDNTLLIIMNYKKHAMQDVD